MDYSTMLAPLVIAVVPMAVMFIKRVLPTAPWVLPILATVIGVVADTISGLATGTSFGPAAGAAFGLAGVGLREMLKHLKAS